MRRVTATDRWLLALWVPLWAVAFGLSLRTAIRDVHFSHVMVASPLDEDAYPTVSGFRPFTTTASELRVGDPLLGVKPNPYTRARGDKLNRGKLVGVSRLSEDLGPG